MSADNVNALITFPNDPTYYAVANASMSNLIWLGEQQQKTIEYHIALISMFGDRYACSRKKPLMEAWLKRASASYTEYGTASFVLPFGPHDPITYIDGYKLISILDQVHRAYQMLDEATFDRVDDGNLSTDYMYFDQYTYDEISKELERALGFRKGC